VKEFKDGWKKEAERKEGRKCKDERNRELEVMKQGLADSSM
jgi:hypothetical protein